MALEPGTRLGAHEIRGLLGAGGMGEVYRATDTRLKREVAIKVLPDAFATDPDRLARFQREAELLASLNHPGIAAIYGLEQLDRRVAIVMELVEGETLDARLKPRDPGADGAGLPLDEALPIARHICEALEAAHDKGVVHRDLKPANIKITPDGRVKLLDFGLAKMLESDPKSSAMSMSPTLSVHATYAGVILGTAAYMSPEQARGKPVDRRTDVWAFGCVLFEMLTGKHAFEPGETVSDAIASVLTREPDVTTLPAGTPPPIRRLLRRCLVEGNTDLGLFDRNGKLQALRLPPGNYRSPRISPDGKTVAFDNEDAKDANIWMYDLAGGGAPRRLTNGGRNRSPVWSPDGQWIAFQSERDADAAIFRQRADGSGLPERLTKPDGGARHSPQSWSRDGATLLMTVEKDKRVALWSLSIGNKQTTPFGDVNSTGQIDASFSPDGHWVAYHIRDSSNQAPLSEVFLQPFPSSGVKHLVPQGGGAPYWLPKTNELVLNVGPQRSAVVAVTTTPRVAFGRPSDFSRVGRIEGPPNQTRRNVDAMPDGEHVIGVVPSGGDGRSAQQVAVVLNWFDELRQRVPVK